MNRVFSRLGLTAVAIVAGAALNAQTSVTGAVSGVVTDNNGSPVAGATVTLKSGQVTRSIVTGADGSFRLGLLNAGSWEASVSKDGFNGYKGTVAVNVNETRGLNVKLAPVSSTTVNVVGNYSSVDVTSSTQGLNTSVDSIREVPLPTRDFSSLAYLAPGVVNSGFGNDPAMGGGSGAENQYVVDGLVTNDFSRGFQGASLVTDFIDQVDVQTGGFKPEYSALGGVFNVVTKSGSNDFQGSAWGTFDARNLEAKPKRGGVDSTFPEDPTKPAQTDPSLPNYNPYRVGDFFQAPPSSRYDLGAEVSGPIIKDKLFYFVGIDGIFTEPKGFQANPDGFTSSDEKDKQFQFVGKLNYYLTQDMQFILFFTHNTFKIDQDYASFVLGGPGNVATATDNKTDSVNLTYQWNINSSTLLNARLGYVKADNKTDPVVQTPAVNDRHQTAYYNPATGLGKGTGWASTQGGAGTYTHEITKTLQLAADLTKYLGTHELKFGLAMLQNEYDLNDGGYNDGNALPGSVLGLYPELYNSNAIGKPVNAYRISGSAKTVRMTYFGDADTSKTHQGALYAQDTWEVIPGFRLAYGFRYETQKLEGNGGQTVFNFTDAKNGLQPRIGFVWDVNNDGKTKISASAGRYFEQIPLRLAARSYGNEYYVRYTAPITYNPNAANGVGTVNFTGAGTFYVNYSTPFNNDPRADGIKAPRRNEVVAGIDHTFDSGISVGMHGKYRKLTSIIEDSSIRPFANSGNPATEFISLYNAGIIANYTNVGGGVYYAGAVLWNPGDHISIDTAPGSIDYNNGIRHISASHLPFPSGFNVYQSADITVDKKTDRMTLSFSYTWSRLYGNYEGVVSSSNGQADGNITALFDDSAYVGYGLLPLDSTSVAKFFGSYRWDMGPGDFTWGWNALYQSGNPRTFFGGGRNANAHAGYPDPLAYGNATPHNGIYGGDGRNPNETNVDMTFTYGIKVGKIKVSPFANVFNVFNTRGVLGYDDTLTDTSGATSPTFGEDNAWQEGRRYRFGVKVTF